MALCLRGARVIIACRDEDRARKAVREIKNRSHNMNVLFMELDLANMRSIREFCKNFLQKEKRLDILINNAGGNLTDAVCSVEMIPTALHHCMHTAWDLSSELVWNRKGVFSCACCSSSRQQGALMLQTAPLNN